VKRNQEDEKLNEIVENLLNKFTECRNKNIRDKYDKSSVVLTLKVFEEIAREHKKVLIIPYDLIPFLPSPESITRCRREIINHKGEFQDDYGMEGITFEHPNKEKVLEKEQ